MPAMIPAWTALDRTSVLSLLASGLNVPPAIRVAHALSPDDLIGVPIVKATRFILERAKANGGLLLTKRGALARIEVKAMFEAIDWPDFDRAAVLLVNRVLNEEDVLCVHFMRMIAFEARLLRRFKGRLMVTKLGLELLAPSSAPALFRILFETTFWRTNLAFFDRMPADHWPQTHIGVVLWSLSVAAHDWGEPEALVATCTIAEPELAATASDFPGFAMVTRVLRPLTWFGLLERKADGEDERRPEWWRPRFYRKTPLFDYALRFSIVLRMAPGPLQ